MEDRKKDEGVEFRPSPQEKDLVILAAQLAGVNVDAFLRNAALQAAHEVVDANEAVELSNRDRDLFLDALDNPREPSANLKTAMKKYRRWK